MVGITGPASMGRKVGNQQQSLLQLFLEMLTPRRRLLASGYSTVHPLWEGLLRARPSGRYDVR